MHVFLSDKVRKKASSSYYIFDFNLNDVKGHFEGSVK